MKIKRLLCLFAAAGALVMPAVLGAAEVAILDTVGPTNGHAQDGALVFRWVSPDEVRSLALRFVPADHAFLTRVELALVQEANYEAAPPFDPIYSPKVEVRIANDSAGKPGSTIAAVEVADVPSWQINDPPLVTVDFPTRPELMPGTPYWIVLVPPTFSELEGKPLSSQAWFEGLAPQHYETMMWYSVVGEWEATALDNFAARVVVDAAATNQETLGMKGDPVPGIAGATFSSFSAPSIAADGRAAFRAKLAGTGITALDATGIWSLGVSGSTTNVARAGFPAPGGGTFALFEDPVIVTGGNLAFTGRLAVGGSVTASNDAGLWADLGAGLIHILQEDGEVPTLAGYKFKKVEWFVLCPDALIIGAKITSTTAPSKSVVLRHDGTDLELVLQPGDSIEIAPGTERIVASFTKPATLGPGYVQGRSANEYDGRVGLLMKFADGSSGIFNLPLK